MAALQPRNNNPFTTAFDDLSPKSSAKDEWEDWNVDSDESPSSTTHGNGLLIDLSDHVPATKSRKSVKPIGTRNTLNRPTQLARVKSRARQKAQNAKAGIKIVTDMSQFRKNAAAAQQKSADSATSKKFANSAALQALEGNPSSPSIGSFAWLKRRPGNTLNNRKSMLADNNSPDLSPVPRPIVIGISVPSSDAGSHQVSPHTAVLETPMDMGPFSDKPSNKLPTSQQQRSVWSPDTEVTESPFSATPGASGMFTQPTAFGSSKMGSQTPPVPTLPSTLKFKYTVGKEDHEDDDAVTPYTPFEEDDSPATTRKPEKLKVTTASPGSASSRAQGWWDHVTTPFMTQSNNPFKNPPQPTGSSSSQGSHEWWDGHDEKARSKPSHLTITTSASEKGGDANAVDAITPAPEPRQESHSEKHRVLLEENQSSNEAPPPYEPSSHHPDIKVAFANHNLNSQPIPSPGPMTPALPGTMTSQGAIGLADIPLTPSGVRPVPGVVLPDRVAGSYRTGDHFYEAPGKFNKRERQRRRHEKEDVVARKVGGYWRGRGCIPEEGCFGRSGREGRKRRRICLGILGGVIAAIILIVVLVVFFTQRAMSSNSGKATGSHPHPHPHPEDSEIPVPQYWLNLTDFPPIPTGVLTVAGPKNPVAASGCFSDKTPSTAWSCALPKEDHDSSGPYGPNQPEFIFQIQFDNSTQNLWKLADEAKPLDLDKRAFVTDKGFKPHPEPPTLEEMRFLGNTTDGIKSSRKEGEPTPFFISLLESIDKTVGPDVLARRQGNAIGGASGNGTGGFNLSDILPPPQLNPDGTGAPARLFPLPIQQPVRLFDRDLPTEHYGFYTYFDKTIYMANARKRDPADEEGGVPIADATSLVTFAQTRFLVKIWTRMGNSTQLLSSSPDTSTNTTAHPDIQPGSMPYPATVIEDMHGGNPSSKIDFAYGVTGDMQIDRANATLVNANIAFKGTVVNGRNDGPDHSLGGYDGGTGGCKCEWVNFEEGSS
ncbi:hypothetical protein GGS20DRAFT_411032 [Poronia punctata]|nr:hypothetical protein GGS20DRAFT_411032 [Poronia punctata]